MEVKAIYIEFECPCVTCGAPPDPLASKSMNVMVTPRNESPVEIIVDDALKPQGKESPGGGPTSNTMPSALNRHRRAISAVSFAEDVKPTDNAEASHRATMNTEEHNFIDDSDNSTLSTEDEESLTNMVEDEDTDGEVPFLRGYMSTHTIRQGVARYAIKRARQDLKPNVLLEAVVDLAVEAKFLATIRHPNIVKMRGTVGSPGSVDFMIIMDRLKMTLRQKMRQWNDESKGKTGILKKLLGGQNNQAMQRDQYADKLLAVYDIARALKYLHNHMYVI